MHEGLPFQAAAVDVESLTGFHRLFVARDSPLPMLESQPLTQATVILQFRASPLGTTFHEQLNNPRRRSEKDTHD